jgi:hypothetical protein
MSATYRLDLTPERWWEALIVAALRYAKESAVLAAPPRLVVPSAIVRTFAAQGKRIVRISPTRFSVEELRRIQMLYMTRHRHWPSGDVADPEYIAFVVDEFGDAMKSYWA